MTEIVAAQTELAPDAIEEGSNGIDEIVALHAAGGLTPTRLQLSDPTLPWERWVALGRLFGRIKRSSSWWIGDWILWGDRVYGEKYAQAIEVTGLSIDTLTNYASVCKRVPPTRRVAALPFSFHEAVASLEPNDQRRWLQRALDENLSREKFRSELRKAREAGELETPNGKAADPAWSEGGPMESRPRQIEAAAKNVWNLGQRNGGEVIVPIDAWMRLGAALGVEE